MFKNIFFIFKLTFLTLTDLKAILFSFNFGKIIPSFEKIIFGSTSLNFIVSFLFSASLLFSPFNPLSNSISYSLFISKSPVIIICSLIFKALYFTFGFTLIYPSRFSSFISSLIVISILGFPPVVVDIFFISKFFSSFASIFFSSTTFTSFCSSISFFSPLHATNKRDKNSAIFFFICLTPFQSPLIYFILYYQSFIEYIL